MTVSKTRRAPSARQAGLVLLLGLTLSACGTSMTTTAPPAPSVTPIAITVDEIVGKWGLASYRDAKDLDRTTAEARKACANPYTVTKGPGGGVMMHLADQPVASEVVLKPAADGRVFLGPQGKPADKRDRLILSYENGVMVTQWVDPDAATRYGTMVF